MSAPPAVFSRKCMLCDNGVNENADGSSQWICAVCRKKKANRALDGVRDDRAVGLALATAEAAPARQFQKQCTAVDAASGSRCKLLAPHPKHPHANERGQFLQELQPGEVSRREAAVVNAALTGRGDNSLQLEAPGGSNKPKPRRHQCASCGRGVNGADRLCHDCRHAGVKEPASIEPPPLLVTTDRNGVSLRAPDSPETPPEWRENPEAYSE